MTTILLVRHGESTANLEELFAGDYDAPLTPLGHTQAECTANFVLNNYKVDAVFSSDLARAYDTGKHIADKLQLPVQTDKGLREINGGLWEAKPFARLGDTHPEEYRLILNDIGNAWCPEGESVAQLDRRVWETVCRIAREHEGKTVVIATHATPVRVVQWHMTGLPADAMQSIPWVSNASVTELKWENGTLSPVKVGQDAHLADMRTFLPSTI